ncbi:MAG: 7TM diverse intracellular signaling domain-containing protein [Crocinitomicaceae bacterium]
MKFKKCIGFKTSILTSGQLFFSVFLMSLLPFYGFSFKIYDDTKQQDLYGADLEILMDPSRKFSVQSIPHSSFEKYNKHSPNFGFYNGAIWVKCKLNTRGARKMILEFANPNLDFVTVYEKSGKGFQQIAHFGDAMPFSERKSSHRLVRLPLILPKEILIRIDNLGDQCFVPIQLFDPDELRKSEFYAQLLWGLYLGVYVFAFLYSCAVFVMMHRKSTFYYLCFLFALAVGHLGLTGFGMQYIWGDSPFLSNRLMPLSASVSVTFLILFAMYFLKTKKFTKRYSVFQYVLIALLGIIGVLSISPWEKGYQISTIAVNAIMLIAVVSTIPIAVLSIRRGFKPAIYYLFSFSFLLIGVTIFVLRNFGVFPGNFLTRYSLQFGSGLDVIFLTLAVIREFKTLKDKSYRTLDQIKVMKEQESTELEREIEKRTLDVSRNKQEIESKNEKVHASINYARVIQKHLISTEEEFIQPFSEGFVFGQPKDIVSGDFYWNASLKTVENDEEVEWDVFCVGDCTGHGVPGALISVLGIRILNSAMKIPEIKGPAAVLDYLDKEFRALFQKTDSNTVIEDGMDCVIGFYNRKAKILKFAGAKNWLGGIIQGECIIYKGDKQEIGGSKVVVPFTETTIQLHKGDRLYFTTDGFTDQFGGEKNKKLKVPNYRELITSHSDLPMNRQKEIIMEFFEAWKGNNEQTDDVLVVGLEI